MVIPGTKLHEDYIAGDYKALTNESTAKLIAKVKENVPPYVRIKRVLRDIPAHQIVAGPNKSDLRLDILSILEKEGKKCRCIRCREVGHFVYKSGQDISSADIELVHRTYEASGGKEHFLSFEETKNDVIIGFLRLRELSDDIIRPEFEEQPTIVVRELHVYGELLGLRSIHKGDLQWQHRGYGKELLAKAEEIGLDNDYSKISVISGIGVREYYRKLGYSLDGPYMSKTL
jgi:elongator complex protein 3